MKVKKLIYFPLCLLISALLISMSGAITNVYLDVEKIQTTKIFNTKQGMNIQTVNTETDIQFTLSSQGSSNFAIVKDTLNGDRLYGWGYNKEGQLGIGKIGNQNFPQLCQFIDLPPMATINSVHIGVENVVAVIVNNSLLYLTGSNKYGLLGNGSEVSTHVLSFTKNDFISDLNKEITHFALGDSILTMIDGKMYGWGRNEFKQIENSDKLLVANPIEIALPAGNVNGIYTTGRNAYLWIDNIIYGIGTLIDGSIANATATTGVIDTWTPLDLSEISGNIKSFKASRGVTGSLCMIVYDDNKVYAWGENKHGNFGTGATSNGELKPIEIKGLPIGEIRNIWVAPLFSAIQVNNDLYLSGNNEFGQLCNGKDTSDLKFNKMDNYQSNDTTKYYIFKEGGMATTDGQMVAWGSNNSGQFGIGTGEKINTKPIIFDGFGESSTITSKDNQTLLASAALKTLLLETGEFDTQALMKYVDLNNFQLATTFSLVPGTTPLADDENQTIDLMLVPNIAYWANPDGAKTINPINLTITGFAVPENSPSIDDPNIDNPNQFPWWWIVVGIGAFIILCIVIWLIIRAVRSKQIYIF